MGAQLKAVQRGFARRQRHENAALLKLLTRESQDAVNTLSKLMGSQDEKIKLEAAKAVIKFQQDLANDINTDDLQRLISQVKYGGPQQLDVEEDDTPSLDFSTVQPVD